MLKTKDSGKHNQPRERNWCQKHLYRLWKIWKLKQTLHIKTFLNNQPFQLELTKSQFYLMLFEMILINIHFQMKYSSLQDQRICKKTLLDITHQPKIKAIMTPQQFGIQFQKGILQLLEMFLSFLLEHKSQKNKNLIFPMRWVMWHWWNLSIQTQKLWNQNNIGKSKNIIKSLYSRLKKQKEPENEIIWD